jgi:fumarate hydratase class II
MPGKVNPVIPEAVMMSCAQVMGNDVTITIAGQSGNFQLNVMLPVIAYNLLQSILLLSASATSLADKAISSFKVKESVIAASLEKNPMLATALNPIIGYLKSSEIVKAAYASQRPILDVACDMTELSKTELEDILDPKNAI